MVEAVEEKAIDTLPKLLVENYNAIGKKVAMRKKHLGIWHKYTWADCYRNIKHLALGLKTLGLERGDKVCIIGDNDPEWYWAELAVQAMGGVAVGMYIDAIPSEMEYIIGHSESSFAVAKDQEQVDKLLKIKDKLPNLKKIIYWEPKGMSSYIMDPSVMYLGDVMELGKKYEETNPDFFEESIKKGKGDELAVLCYTSGTTGSLPKGAMLSHDYLIKGCIRAFQVNPVYQDDEYVSFVPPAWVAEQLLGITSWLLWRMKVNFPEEPETVQENIREIGPQGILLGPRQWENLFSVVQMKINDTSAIKRLLYRACLIVGYKVADFELEKRRRPPLLWRLLYVIADWVCFRPIRDHLGLKKVRLGITGGSSLGPDIFRWFRAIGVNIKEMYGLTEINPVAAHYDILKAGTVGPPAPGVTIRISDEGEIIAKSGVIFQGYYKQPEETEKVVEKRWVKTGDAGVFEEEGHLIILDRVKAMLTLRGGQKYSPTYIENRLKFSPYIKDVMVVGGEEREFCFAIINIDFDNVGRWAEKNKISYTTYVDLSQKPEIYDLIQREVVRVNKALPPAAQLKSFALLPKEFDPDEGELTRTRKLRRAVLESKYGKLISAAYKGEAKVATEAQVTYKDGRKGSITTDINIRAVE